ncbi:phosphoribosyltransferase [Agrobacterium radiobacter]|jgi:adenine/guanine phosphoribosyltransferase-like PRPP-binding protein|uniref:Phosphoribosyltransferase n=1 Tax=Agrobacterium tumefaciens str. B6 TaxID=1183423 RepID=A0A822VAZ2_AGRTU|nr:phosphoribosyltransferase [Agrobacterium tumefaciens]MQB26026.1 phosphoribosyltransferase [Agrobacterium tumefaciens]NTA07856.1 phosphoribosyltransferase [Agrobacterium tumefaciens]NTA94253.1 phosphoribosyltransferase [Agrobacterium tumefaciens]NTB15460.1 phosphoribosyltransferase [Agrobacterium tumefaciens]OCJ35174.1 phosphoribosyltransferase [Agrobacterium tumefaciens]
MPPSASPAAHSPAAPHEFWQDILPPATFGTAGPHSSFFPAELDDGRQICLPVRPLADGEHALASLIVNQASFAVLEALAADLAAKLATFNADVVIGLPTLGLTLAAAVARHLGHSRYVPLGTSRKFWYLEELSVPMSSITTRQEKRLYIDPRMLPLIENRRVALVDDVISSGSSIVSGLALLAASGIRPAVIGAAMLQSDRWREKIAAFGPEWPERVRGVFATPLLTKAEDGWRA